MSLDLLCVARLDGYFERVNPSWTRTLGWSEEELLAVPSLDIVHPEDRERTLAARRRLGSGHALGIVNRYLCKDGSYRWLEWRSVADVAGGLVYAAARDITEQKRSEEALAKATAMQTHLQSQLVIADRLASVGMLASGVAHEINNPLASVSANIALIVEALGRGPAGAERDELLAMAMDVDHAAARIQKIVAGLSTFARAEREQVLRPTNVADVLDLAVEMTTSELRQRARLVKDYGEIPIAAADEARLGQVFINLLVNAAQAIASVDGHAHEIRIVTSTDAAGRPSIAIHDSGIGIPPRLIDRVFDPFFTTKPVGMGTGLGLTIARNLVTAMGGEITVTSEERRGTIFRVVLHPAVAPLPAVATVRSTTPPPITTVAVSRILVVDDEPSVGAVLARVLRDRDVTVVSRAADALDLLAAGRHFDLVLSDLMMPELSGMDLYDEVRRRFPAVASRFVFMSGGAFTPGAIAFLERVSNERIDKPFAPQRVRELVERLVGR